jgi:hypothetical protein
MENNLTTPTSLEQATTPVYRSKKNYRNKVILYSVLIVAGCWGFWEGSGHFFTEEYYYPKMTIGCPLLVIILLVALIWESVLFLGKKPLFTLSAQGIALHENPCKRVGLVRWQDLDSYREFAVDKWKRRLVLYVKNPEAYINAIPEKKRKQYKRASDANGGGIVWMESGEMEYDVEQLKQQLSRHIERHA